MSQTQLYNEAELVVRMQSGDPKAFTALYNYYSAPIYLNVRKMVKSEDSAHEIVQELFTQVWQKRSTLQIGQNFGGYLYRIAQNLVYDFFRKLKRDKQLYFHFKTIVTENYNHVEEMLINRENSDLLEKAIQNLSPQQKKAYRLCKLEGLTYKETAERLGISPLTVKEYIVKANHSIHDYIGSNMNNAFLLVILFILREIK